MNGSREFPSYYPWSQEVLEANLSQYDRGDLASLDLELTAKCTLVSCIYCDSRPGVGKEQRGELNADETEMLLRDGKELGLKWTYICGLGEPLEDPKFERMVQTATSLGIRISIFTNGLKIDEERAKWLHDNKVCLILKMDSLDAKTFDKILGKVGAARKVYDAAQFLIDAGYGRNCTGGYTDLALSIVPTQLNLQSIPRVIEYAKERNIFASIGELEHAGRASRVKTYNSLSLSCDEIADFKKVVDELLWKGYQRPICPAIITGVHIDNVGNLIVDGDTGLNCKWFLLREPQTRILGNVRTSSLRDLLKLVRTYRSECFRLNSDAIRKCESVQCELGGCGGRPDLIFGLARKHLS